LKKNLILFFDESTFIQEEKFSFLNDTLENFSSLEKVDTINILQQNDNEIDFKSIFEDTFLNNNHMNDYENAFKL